MTRDDKIYEPTVSSWELSEAEREKLYDKTEIVLEILKPAFADVKRRIDTGAWAVEGAQGVLIFVESNVVTICLTTIVWEDTHRYRLAGRFWQNIPFEALTPEALLHAVGEGIEARRAELIACRFCGKLVAPEMISRGACPKCEYEHLGIIH